jgi:hypothetical protein
MTATPTVVARISRADCLIPPTNENIELALSKISAALQGIRSCNQPDTEDLLLVEAQHLLLDNTENRKPVSSKRPRSVALISKRKTPMRTCQERIL